MKNRNLGRIFFTALLCFLALSLTTAAYGQGKGGGGGRGSGGGGGHAGGPPPGVGVDRGLGNASDRSNGRSDSGMGTASDRSNGRSGAGLERARLAGENRREAERELREHPGVAHAFHVNANDLRSGYQTALAANPNLKFGQYVAATRLAQNLNGRFPNITRSAILAGFADGHSIGRTLQNLGLNSHEAEVAKKQAERELKQARH
ncbi:MAG: hypothetical protein ABJC10_12860 [Acidobacteriota bacterium]